MFRILREAARNPGLASSMLQARMHRNYCKIFGGRYFIQREGLRSGSDSGYYIRAVRGFLLNEKKYSSFKRDPIYNSVLEHVSQENGRNYLDIISDQTPELLDLIASFKENDALGNPRVFPYDLIGEISPTTLRYIKVASDLKKIFGDINGFDIAEIGVGYGGQYLIIDKIWKLGVYILFDLDPVLDLSKKYLESHVMRSTYITFTLNRYAGIEELDLVISNYAFSELPKIIQERYIDKVLIKSKRGYMTMNSGSSADKFRHENRMTIETLGTHLPNLEIIPEKPLTRPQNYIIIWGHQ